MECICWYSFWFFVNFTDKLLTALNDFNCGGIFSENCYQLTIVQENLHCSLVGVSSQELCGVWPPSMYEMTTEPQDSWGCRFIDSVTPLTEVKLGFLLVPPFIHTSLQGEWLTKQREERISVSIPSYNRVWICTFAMQEQMRISICSL